MDAARRVAAERQLTLAGKFARHRDHQRPVQGGKTAVGAQGVGDPPTRTPQQPNAGATCRPTTGTGPAAEPPRGWSSQASCRGAGRGGLAARRRARR
jgi:hypothetical protein